MNSRENSKRHGTQEAYYPQCSNYANGTLQARHRVQMEWVTNRQKSLHRECDNGEHRHVSGSAKTQLRLESAIKLMELTPPISELSSCRTLIQGCKDIDASRDSGRTEVL